MERIIIENAACDPKGCVEYALKWLEEKGGGAVAGDLKGNYHDSFGVDTESEFSKLQERLKNRNIRLTWRRGRGENALPSHGNVVAWFPTKWLINELEDSDLDALFVLGWSESDFREWVDENDPEILVVRKGDENN